MRRRSMSRIALSLGALLGAAGSFPAVQAQSPQFRRGDSNIDGTLDLSDAVQLLGFLYLGSPAAIGCRDASDANDDGDLDLSDGVSILTFLFIGSAPLPPPGSDCGNDPTQDGLDCGAYGHCTVSLTLFRISELHLRDPHIFVNAPFFGCTDITDQVPLGAAQSFNEELNESISTDLDGDGFLDLNLLITFRPLDQDPPGEGEVEISAGSCTAAPNGRSCSADPGSGVSPYSNKASGVCLTPTARTLSPRSYSPSVASASAPCFASGPSSWVLEVAGTPLPLRGVQVAAAYGGDPASALLGGLLMGFLRESDADAALLDPSLPIVGGAPMSSVLPGGRGSCTNHNDRDQGPDGAGGTTSGWWLYFNFKAEKVAAPGA